MTPYSKQPFSPFLPRWASTYMYYTVLHVHVHDSTCTCTCILHILGGLIHGSTNSISTLHLSEGASAHETHTNHCFILFTRVLMPTLSNQNCQSQDTNFSGCTGRYLVRCNAKYPPLYKLKSKGKKWYE